MRRRRTGGRVSRRGDARRICRWFVAGVAAAALAGCTGADRNDPTYNTKRILINDTRQ